MQKVKSKSEEFLLAESKKEKEQITLYLDSDLVDSIDDFIHETKKRLLPHKKKKLNRTLIIQLLLNVVMADYAKLEDESFLIRIISSWQSDAN